VKRTGIAVNQDGDLMMIPRTQILNSLIDFLICVSKDLNDTFID
jgi:hypothetical protein